MSVVTHAMDRTYRSQMSAWLSQHSDSAFPAIGTEVSPFTTGILFTAVEHKLAFPTSFREDSVVAPSIIPTAAGGVMSLPGKAILYLNDSSGVRESRSKRLRVGSFYAPAHPSISNGCSMACRFPNGPR